MAATGTPTPNLGLRIPVGTDPASVDDINYNSNLLDTVLGAVGNTSVKDQIDELSDQIATKMNKYRYTMSGHSEIASTDVTACISAYGATSSCSVIFEFYRSDTGNVVGVLTYEHISNSYGAGMLVSYYNDGIFYVKNANGTITITKIT